MNAPISEDDLHAWADGQLNAARLTRVEAWLAAHPEQRAQAEEWRAQSAALHRAFDRVLDEPLPARLLPAANAGRWLDARKMAAVAWVALGVVCGYILRGETARDPATAAMASLPRQAAVAHAVFVPEVRHPVEVGADQEAHLAAWLSKRLGAPLRPPQLDEAGYRLVGGRLLPGDSGEVAQFMYENAARNRLTLYLRPAAPKQADTAFRYAQEKGIDVFYWTDSRFGYALSGNTGREDMLHLAEIVYRQHGR
ncbi:MAG: anti-sigma factor [Rhodocyclales bacterium]|nr:anti-sigma factor [Rhodocyclales bacterium]